MGDQVTVLCLMGGVLAVPVGPVAAVLHRRAHADDAEGGRGGLLAATVVGALSTTALSWGLLSVGAAMSASERSDGVSDQERLQNLALSVGVGVVILAAGMVARRRRAPTMSRWMAALPLPIMYGCYLAAGILATIGRAMIAVARQLAG